MPTSRTRMSGRFLVRACAGLALVAALGLGASHATAQTQDRPERQPATGVREAPTPQERLPATQPRRAMDPDEGMTLRGRRIAVLVGEGFHDGETFMPLAYLANRGAHVTVIGIEPGVIKAYNSDMTIRVERAVRDVNYRQFDALVLPGGRGPSVLRQNDAVVSFAREFFESGRPVAAICHGPQVLITAGVLDGKRATCIANISSELQEAGATYEDAPVVRDGNLITSRVPDDIPAFCMKIEEVIIEMTEDRRPERPTRPERPERPDRPDRPGRAPGR
jgi:protease I